VCACIPEVFGNVGIACLVRQNADTESAESSHTHIFSSTGVISLLAGEQSMVVALVIAPQCVLQCHGSQLIDTMVTGGKEGSATQEI